MTDLQIRLWDSVIHKLFFFFYSGRYCCIILSKCGFSFSNYLFTWYMGGVWSHPLRGYTLVKLPCSFHLDCCIILFFLHSSIAGRQVFCLVVIKLLRRKLGAEWWSNLIRTFIDFLSQVLVDLSTEFPNFIILWHQCQTANHAGLFFLMAVLLLKKNRTKVEKKIIYVETQLSAYLKSNRIKEVGKKHISCFFIIKIRS